MHPVHKIKRERKDAEYTDSVRRKLNKHRRYSDVPSEVAQSMMVKEEYGDMLPYDTSNAESSDSDCGPTPSSYLHDKIGIYVQDDTGSSVDKSQLVRLLPVDFGVVIVSYIGEESIDNRPCFSCSLRLNITDKDTILRWLKLFEQKTFTVYRVDSTFKCEKSKKLVFKKNFRCQHNQYVHQNRKKENTRKKRIEHTGCPAKVSLTIKQQDMLRTTDLYLKEYPAVINIRFNHNHDSRTEREMHKIIMKSKIRALDVKPKMLYSEIRLIEGNNVIGEMLENKRIEDMAIEQRVGSDEEKKVALVNTDWNDVLCDDVFLERSNHSISMEKDNQTPPYEDALLEIDRCCNILKQKTLEKPGIFHLPLMNFLEAFNTFKSDADMATALASFGRYSDTVIAYKKEDVDLHSNIIGVPAIPEGRRKVYTAGYKMMLSSDEYTKLNSYT